MLITKHIMFVGFSLRDDAFNEIAATVPRYTEIYGDIRICTEV